MTPIFSIQKVNRGTSGGWPHAWLCGSNRHLVKQVKFLCLPGNYMNLVALAGNPTLGEKQRETQSPSPLFELRSLPTPTTSTGPRQTCQCVSANCQHGWGHSQSLHENTTSQPHRTRSNHHNEGLGTSSPRPEKDLQATLTPAPRPHPQTNRWDAQRGKLTFVSVQSEGCQEKFYFSDHWVNEWINVSKLLFRKLSYRYRTGD